MIAAGETGFADWPALRGNRRQKTTVSLVLFFLAAAYLLQVATPMRLGTDAIVYLSLASSETDGQGFLYHGAPERYPLGYPTLLFILTRTGLGTAWAFVGLNCLLLAAGLFATYRLLVRELNYSDLGALIICALTLLSFVMVKHLTQLVSDVPFFGLSLVSLLALQSLQRSEQSLPRRVLHFVLAGTLVGCSIWIRTIGIALLPNLLIAPLGDLGSLAERLRGMRNRRVVVAISMGLVFLAVTAIVWVARTQYFRLALLNYRSRGIGRSLFKLADFRATELGEMVVNVPSSKLHGHAAPVILAVGMLSLAAILFAAWNRRRRAGVVDVYVLSYLAILCATPWEDARYLLPVVPLLFGYFGLLARRWKRYRPMRLCLAVYLAWFSLSGIIALGYSTRLTFAGSRFPDEYGDGLLRSTYACALRNDCAPADGKIDPDALLLLRRYEPRAKR